MPNRLYYGKNYELMFAHNEDAGSIYELHKIYQSSKYIKARSFDYIQENISRFIVYKYSEILLGSAEILSLNEKIRELGAFVVHPNCAVNDKLIVSKSLIAYAQSYAKQCDSILVSLTNNAKLQEIYRSVGGIQAADDAFMERRNRSPGVEVFVL